MVPKEFTATTCSPRFKKSFVEGGLVRGDGLGDLLR
jgi:hypothetical protein